MNYYFGILLCIAFIIGKIVYEKLLNKQNKIDVKHYVKEGLLLFVSYVLLIQVLIYFKMDESLDLLSGTEIRLKSLTSNQPMVFTNEPPF